MSVGEIPRHVAIIMDGNGRWAKQRGLPRTAGHRRGIDRIREIIKAADKLGIKYITFFAFSTENWSRPKKEVDMLMRSLDNFLKRHLKKIHRDNICLRIIGKEESLPRYLQKRLKEAQRYTEKNSGLTVIMALNYGSRTEIVEAVKKIVSEVTRDNLDLSSLDGKGFSEFLYTRGLPDPDLLIRTSGEMRLSNFLLWQLSYAELYFIQKYWPDFTGEDLRAAIEVYGKRQRRFGNINAYKKNN
jgi:undecaprenyl diphosphate synthase